MMQLEERFFSTHVFLPRTKHFLSGQGNLFIALTPWGGSKAYPEKDVFEELDSTFHVLLEDKDSTRPFQNFLSLSAPENHLRSAVIKTNKSIHDKANQNMYSCGFEALLIYTTQSSFCTIVQIGGPSILLDQQKTNLKLKGNFQNLNSPLPCEAPLPHQLLGVHPDISFHPFSFSYQGGDHLILFHRQSEIPLPWLNTQNREIKHLSMLATEDKPHLPFWLGILKLP